MTTLAPVDAMAWFPHPKTYEPCHNCCQWKVLTEQYLCGPCLAENRRLTKMAVDQWVAELPEVIANVRPA